MSVLAVVGAQWGDEGKGKIVDLLASFCPQWSWVTEAEASHLKSRAAHFVVERSFLEVNQDFSVFQELVEHGLKLIAPDRRDVFRAAIEHRLHVQHAGAG